MWSLSGSQARRPESNHHLRLQPNQAKALVCALGVLVFLADIMTPADVDLGIFYSFVIALCAWTRSPRFLWGTAIVFAAAILPGQLLSAPPVVGPVSWTVWANRAFATATLGVVAGLVHLRMRNVGSLERANDSLKSANQKLHTALDEITTLRGVLLICSYCKKVKANPETWVDLENYVRKNSDTEFTHGVCPDCIQKLTPESAHDGKGLAGSAPQEPL
jgi:hypothetical protein